MSRTIVQSTLAVIVAALGAAAASAQDNAPAAFPHREIRGPQGLPGAKGIFAHLNQVVFTRDGAKMAAGAGVNIFVWNVADGKELVRILLPEEQIYHWLVFADDGKTLVWCGREDPQVRVFDVKTGRQLREFPQADPYKEQREKARARGQKVEGFSSRFQTFSPDGKLMVFNGRSFSQGFDLVETATGKVVVSGGEAKDCRGCAFSPDSQQLATQSGNGGLWLWDVKTGKLIREFCPDNRHGGGAYKFVTFSPDGKFLASGGHTREALDVWNVATGKLVCSIPSKNYFYSVSFAPGGQSLVCTEADGKPYLYHLVAEKKIYHFNPPQWQAHFVTFTPDGKRVAIIGEPTERNPNIRQESIFLYDIPAAALNPPAAQVDDATLEKLWDDFSTDNELRLQRILQAFRSAPKPAITLFRNKILPVPKEQQAKAEQWLTQLDDDDFNTRDQAVKELQLLAHQFTPLLQARKEKAPPGEVRNRLTFILRQMANEPLPAWLIREQRALAFLEQVKTPEARELLGRLGQGAPLARLTVAARAAGERLATGENAPK